MADVHERFRSIRDAHRAAYGSEAAWQCVLGLMAIEVLGPIADSLTAVPDPPPQSAARRFWSALPGYFDGDMSVPRRD